MQNILLILTSEGCFYIRHIQRSKPPSEWMTCPVTQPPSGLTRNWINRATSSGAPIRPNGKLGLSAVRVASSIQVESVGPGLTALTVAALFLCCLFLEPLFASIPAFATAPALVFVAAGFLSPLRNLDWDDMAVAVPVMLMAVLMPLTFSIAAGIAIGFLAYVVIHALAGRLDQINAGTYVITGFGCLWMATPFI